MHLLAILLFVLFAPIVEDINAVDAANNMKAIAFHEPVNPCPGIDYPAVLSLYDPELGGVNCGEDCSTVATGPMEDWMYEVAGACPAELLGATVHFPDVDHSLQCVDNGGAIKASWSDRDRQCVVYFDTLWHLPDENGDGRVDRNEDGSIDGVPYWLFWFQEKWTVSWN